MSQKEWARNEITIAMKRENQDYKPFTGFNKKVSDVLDRLNITNDMRPKRFRNPFDYGCACYESAFKAFSSLCDDGHSGMSFGYTRNILECLLNGRPLTGIEDIPENWNQCSTDRGKYTTYQCNRMSSFFKDVYKDGTIKYHDIDRYYCKDVVTGSTFTNSTCSNILNEMFPITMPYYGTSRRFEFRVEDCLTDRKNGDFDTFAIWDLTTDKGEIININRFFTECIVDGVSKFTECTRDMWDLCKAEHKRREEREIKLV